MFTIHQIHEAFSKVKSGADFPQFVQDLKSIGVSHYDNFAEDGQTEYFGTNGFLLNGEPKYPSLIVAEDGSEENLREAISIHQQGRTDYPTFCKQATAAGVEKWRTDTNNMTVTYYDKSGNVLVKESIPVS